MKKIFTLHFLLLTFFLLVPRPTYAWGDAIPATLLKQSMEQIQRGIEGTILSAVKTAAITAITSQVDRLLTGTGLAEPPVIRNYDDYLRVQPQLEARAAVHNFLTRTYRSLGSTANYASASGGNGSEVRGSYETRLQDSIKKRLTNQATAKGYDLNEYCGDVEQTLKLGREGLFLCLDAWKKNPLNNPYGASLIAEQEYQRVYDEIRYQRQIMATSSGFTPGIDPKTGQVTTPSGTIAAVYNDAQTLATKVLAAAQNPQELVSGVVFALINRGINTIANKAAGAVESVVNKTVGKAVTEINKVAGDTGKVLRTVDGYILKADGYVTEAGYQAEQYNQLKQQANSSTKAPPKPSSSGVTTPGGDEVY